MRRPRQCHNCGEWFIWAFDAQTVCCVGHEGPRWIDDPRAYAVYVEYREWFRNLPNVRTGGKFKESLR